MAITPRTTINPQNMASRWQNGVAAAGARWLAGIKSPRALPNANPTQNAANWQAGVAGAVPKYEHNISGAGYLTRLENGATAKQGSYTGSGAAHASDMLSSAQKIATAIEQIVPTLPRKGPRGTNTGRSTAFQDAMHARRGTLGKTE
jgi:hypothetical protein